MKRFVYFFLSAVIIIAGSWSGFYFFVSSKIKQQIENLANYNQEAKISCDKFYISGFPFKFIAHCQKAKLIDGDIEFTLEKLQAQYFIFSPMSIKINAFSPLNYYNEFFASRQKLSWDEFSANIALSGWKLKNADINAANINYVDLLIGENLILKANNIAFSLSGKEGEFDKEKQLISPILSGKISGFNFKNLYIDNGNLDLRAKFTNLPSDIRQWGNEEILRLWQQNQGQIIFEKFYGKDNEKEINIKGKIGLDEYGFLSGALAIKSQNIVELIAPNFREEIQPIIFGSQNEDGSYFQNINFKDGKIYSGLMPIGQLPPLL